MAQSAAPLIESSFLERLERLTIHWQKSFPGLVGGHNDSRFAGAGQEFLDHRNFHAGDDLRAINWRAYMRLEKLFLKMFQVEPRVPVRLLLDTSRSMDTATQSTPKFQYACKLAAALCYVGLVRLDMIVVQPFADTLAQNLTCGGGRHRFLPVVDFLSQLKPEGKTDYLQVSRQFLNTYPQRGLVIIISDFLEDGDCTKPLQYLSDFGHELLLVQLWAEEDRTPPWDGELDLVDAESGDVLKVAFDETARREYTANFDAYSENLRRMAHRAGGRYVALPTSVPLEQAVFTDLVQARGIA